MDCAEEIEHYLREASVIGASAYSLGGGHPNKRLLILEGGVAVVAKPAEDENTTNAARREAAAWSIIRQLGWADMMGATVMRTVHGLGDAFEASVQVVWPSHDPNLPRDQFPEEDTARAAVFDAVILHTDRVNNNWLGVPSAETGAQPRLKLVDNGFALDCPGRGTEVQSDFFNDWKDEEIPPEALEALGELLGDWPPPDVPDLLGDGATSNVEARATLLAERGVLSMDDPE